MNNSSSSQAQAPAAAAAAAAAASASASESPRPQKRLKSNHASSDVNGTKSISSSSSISTSSKWLDSLDAEDQRAVSQFRSFLQIKSLSDDGPKNGQHAAAIAFLTQLCERAGLKTAVYTYTEGNPVLVATLVGKDPSLPSLLFNSHFDVVPVEMEHWTHDPWAAHLDEETGRIYGRGTQDMKCVPIMLLEALTRLYDHHAAKGAAGEGQGSPEHLFLRTIHLSFMPDEEIGGVKGMKAWVTTEEFRSLNVGCAFDEGLANPSQDMTVFCGERAIWWLHVLATGPVGHGSRFIERPAMQKLVDVINRFLAFREEQESLYKGHGPGCRHAVAKRLGEVTTLNLTALRGGVTPDGGKSFNLNCVPSEAMAGFDIRIPPHVDLEAFENKLKEWTSEEGVSYEFIFKCVDNPVTSTDPVENPYWGVFVEELNRQGIKVDPQIFPAGTDGRFLRLVGVPCFGFSPINQTPILLHDHDEYLSVPVFLQGIRVFEGILQSIGNSACVIAPKDGTASNGAEGSAAAAAAGAGSSQN